MGSMLFVAVFIALQFATGLANPEAKRLYDDLLSNYNRLIRPVGNNSDRLTVKMGLRLSQLIDVVSIRLYFYSYFHYFIFFNKIHNLRSSVFSYLSSMSGQYITAVYLWTVSEFHHFIFLKIFAGSRFIST